MSELNERQRRIRLESKLSALQDERDKLADELAQVNAAFSSLSALVMEREPDKWRVWLEAQQKSRAKS
jgi:predicted nuclease with TOPRIM domain